MRLVAFFSARRCLDCDSLADETINRVVLKFDQTEIASRGAYFLGVARNIFLESLRKRSKETDLEDVVLIQPEEESDERMDCLESCLKELDPSERTLIIGYYSEEKSAKFSCREKLASEFGIAITALRMKIVRLKQRLRQCVERCEGTT